MSGDPRTIEELKEHWTDFAPLFEQALEPNTTSLAWVLVHQLRLPEATGLLEVGCGTGKCAARLTTELLDDEARHVISDLSPGMVERARKRVPPEVGVREANVEELPFEDASFDRYLANLVLMLTPDTDAALREARRVLAPGGIAAWSVWGRPEHSPMFTLPPQAAESVGVQLDTSKRSNFHLGQRDALMKRVTDAGFTDVLAWYHPMVFPCLNGREFADMVLETPSWRQQTANGPSEKVQAFRDTLTQLADETLQSGSPITLEALMVVARVPA